MLGGELEPHHYILVFILGCDCIGFIWIPFTELCWQGAAFSAVCAGLSSLTMLYNAYPWQWPSRVVMPVAGIVIICICWLMRLICAD